MPLFARAGEGDGVGIGEAIHLAVVDPYIRDYDRGGEDG